MENKTLAIAVALLLAGIAIIYFAREINNRDTHLPAAFEQPDQKQTDLQK